MIPEPTCIPISMDTACILISMDTACIPISMDTACIPISVDTACIPISIDTAPWGKPLVCKYGCVHSLHNSAPSAAWLTFPALRNKTTNADTPDTRLTIVRQIRLREYQSSHQVSRAHAAVAVWLVQPGVTHGQSIRMSSQSQNQGKCQHRRYNSEGVLRSPLISSQLQTKCKVVVIV